MNRRYLTIALLVCTALSMALILTPIVEARCRPPRISLSAPKGERGSTLTVTGELFWLRCIDEGPLPLPPMEPTRKIQLLLKQGDQTRLLTTVDADASLRFLVTVNIPVDAAPGIASVVARADAYPAAAGETPQPIAFQVVAP